MRIKRDLLYRVDGGPGQWERLVVLMGLELRVLSFRVRVGYKGLVCGDSCLPQPLHGEMEVGFFSPFMASEDCPSV